LLGIFAKVITAITTKVGFVFHAVDTKQYTLSSYGALELSNKGSIEAVLGVAKATHDISNSADKLSLICPCPVISTNHHLGTRPSIPTLNLAARGGDNIAQPVGAEHTIDKTVGVIAQAVRKESKSASKLLLSKVGKTLMGRLSYIRHQNQQKSSFSTNGFVNGIQRHQNYHRSC
jgi:hypothetical protein